MSDVYEQVLAQESTVGVEASLTAYRAIVDNASVQDIKLKELAILRIARLLATARRSDDLMNELVALRRFFATISKTRTAVIVRSVIEEVSKVAGSEQLLIRLCNDTIEWCKAEKRSVLRQKTETKLAGLLADVGETTRALELLKPLLREVKQLDDKELLVEIHLIESACYHSQHNIARSKAALTSARTNANAIYVLPSVQGRIDLTAGVLHTEEGDHKTAYSYFLEAFEQYNTLEHPEAERALSYMLLSKVMSGQPGDVATLIQGKVALKYSAVPSVQVLRRIAAAYKNRSLQEFEAVMKDSRGLIEADRLLSVQLSSVQDTMLEQNLSRLIEPYSCVEIDHVAHLIQLPLPVVEKKLSQMILDQKLAGILDQGNGQLILFEPQPEDKTFNYAVDTLKELGNVVEALSTKQKVLN